MKPCFCSELTMRDIKETVDTLRPLKIFINGKIAWDEDTDSLVKYETLFNLKLIVTEIKFTIVSLHHSHVMITAKQ